MMKKSSHAYVAGEFTPPRKRGGKKRGIRVVRGGEELALLVVKTALASGMKNSLALVVKNGLSP